MSVEEVREQPSPRRVDTFFLIVLILTVVATFVIRFSGPIEDGDLWFHLAYGRYFIDNHTLIPDHSLYSWTTAAANSSIYCAWLAEIILYTLNQIYGLTALFVFRYIFALVYLSLLIYQSKKEKILNSYVPWMIGGLGITMSTAGIMIKPEIFSYVFMVITVWIWWVNRTSQGRGLSFYALPAIFLLWVNSHGGIIFGVVYLILLFAGDMMNRWFFPQETLAQEKRKHFNLSLLLCGISLFLTPYGWKYPGHLISSLLLSNKFRGDVKTVFPYRNIFSPDAIHLHFFQYLIIVSFILALLLLPKILKRRLDLSLIITNMAFGLLYCLFLRATYFWIPIFSFSAIYLFSSEKAWWNRFKEGIFIYIRTGFIILALVVLLRADCESICYHNVNFGFSPYSLVEEAAFIKKNFSCSRLGNDYNSGSSLLWELWPQTKVFIDARYFPYQSWYPEYQSFTEGKDIQSFLKKYKCDIWCLSYDFPQLNYFLTSPEWEVAYFGPSACIFVTVGIGNTNQKPVVSDAVFRVDLFQAVKIEYAALSYGDIPLAERIVETMHRNFPCSAQMMALCKAHNELGVALAMTNRQDEAINHFFYTILINGKFESGYINLGNTLLVQGKIQEAKKFYFTALRLNPKNEAAIKGLALAKEMIKSKPGPKNRSPKSSK